MPLLSPLFAPFSLFLAPFSVLPPLPSSPLFLPAQVFLAFFPLLGLLLLLLELRAFLRRVDRVRFHEVRRSGRGFVLDLGVISRGIRQHLSVEDVRPPRSLGLSPAGLPVGLLSRAATCPLAVVPFLAGPRVQQVLVGCAFLLGFPPGFLPPPPAPPAVLPVPLAVGPPAYVLPPAVPLPLAELRGVVVGVAKVVTRVVVMFLRLDSYVVPAGGGLGLQGRGRGDVPAIKGLRERHLSDLHAGPVAFGEDGVRDAGRREQSSVDKEGKKAVLGNDVGRLKSISCLKKNRFKYRSLEFRIRIL